MVITPLVQTLMWIRIAFSPRKSLFIEDIFSMPSTVHLRKLIVVSSLFDSPMGCSAWNYLLIGLVGRVFANGPGDRGSISGRVIPKT